MKLKKLTFITLLLMGTLFASQNIGCDVEFIRGLPIFGEYWCPVQQTQIDTLLDDLRLDNIFCGKGILSIPCRTGFGFVTGLFSAVLVFVLILLVDKTIFGKNPTEVLVALVLAGILGYFFMVQIISQWWFLIMFVPVILALVYKK